MNLQISVQQDQGCVLLEVDGEVDVSNASELRASLDKALADGACTRIEVDMSRVAYIDSTGIGVLVGAAHKASGADKQFGICHAQSNVMRVFGLLGVDKILNIT